VITAVDEPIDATKCGGRENCTDEGKRCMTHELWANLNAHIFAYLRSVSLAQLVADQDKSDVAVVHDHRQQTAAGSRKPEPETIG
jgi:Rrf2 family transcriptional regulator, iron-sulfur cluster assembly transcription factor